MTPSWCAVAKGPSTAEPQSANRQATAALRYRIVAVTYLTSRSAESCASTGWSRPCLATRAAGTPLRSPISSSWRLARAIDALGEVADVGLAVATEWGVLIPVLALGGRRVLCRSGDRAPGGRQAGPVAAGSTRLMPRRFSPPCPTSARPA